MNDLMAFLDEISELMEETVSYLHSWCCIRDGKYRMVDYRGVKLAVITLLGSATANGEDSHDIIGRFKAGYNDGTIILSTFPFGLSKEYEDELYKKHAEHVKHFEEKYNIVEYAQQN